MHTTFMHDSFRRAGTAHRTLTRAPLVPSQDVSRYQARDMPAPIYDLDREGGDFPRSILMPALAVAITGGGIALIQRLGAWLSR